MTPQEVNTLAAVIADKLACNKSKKEILDLKILLQQIISNLCTYLID